MKYNSLNEIENTVVESFKAFCQSQGWSLKAYEGDLSHDVKNTILRFSGGSVTTVRFIATKIAASNLYGEDVLYSDSYTVICDKIKNWLKENAQ